MPEFRQCHLNVLARLLHQSHGHVHSHSHAEPTMNNPRLPAVAVPRFLLPQLSWSARAVRPAALSTTDARRHITSGGHNAHGASVTAAIRQHSQLRSRTESHSLAAGYKAAGSFRRSFSATAPQLKDHHFDTLKFVQRLKDEGFTEEQAEGMMRVLSDVIEERFVPCLRHEETRTDNYQHTKPHSNDGPP